MDAPKVDRVLVAVDGSDESMVAVDHAVAVADRYAAELVVLYVLPREKYQAMAVGEVAVEAISETAQSVLADAANVGETAGLSVRQATAYGFSPYRKLTHPGSVVLDVAEDFVADLLVIPREREAGATLGKAATYVLEYASQPVLAV